VSELLRHQGLFAIHAAGVERDGDAVLILGPPGAGKTTAMLSLLWDGWRLLSDDHPLLRDGEARVEVLPFPVPARLTKDTLARFSDVLPRAPSPVAGGKATVPIEDIAPSGIGAPGRPVALLLPQVVDWPHSRLVPLSRGQALEEALRLTLGLANADPPVDRRHFALLGRLVRETPCFRLMSGSRVEEDLSHTVEPLLSAAAA
jgi:hypothetical protein